MIDCFTVHQRNYGHWDICNKNKRLFCIRGGPGEYVVIDERPDKNQTLKFKTVNACMQFITDDLMYELIIVDGQKPIVIDSWNI